MYVGYEEDDLTREAELAGVRVQSPQEGSRTKLQSGRSSPSISDRATPREWYDETGTRRRCKT